MNTYAYEAVDGSGLDVNGVIEVATQSQALRRLKEMGFFPTKVREKQRRRDWQAIRQVRPTALIAKGASVNFRVRGAVRPRVLTVFTRQLATLLEAGMP